MLEGGKHIRLHLALHSKIKDLKLMRKGKTDNIMKKKSFLFSKVRLQICLINELDLGIDIGKVKQKFISILT